jgi:hypothetical protein
MKKATASAGAILAFVVLSFGSALSAPVRGTPGSDERIDWCRTAHINCVDKGNKACQDKFPVGAKLNACADGVILACGSSFGKDSDCPTAQRISRPRVKLPQGQVFAPK